MNKILYFLIPIGMAWALLSNSGGAAAVQNVDRTSSPLGVGSYFMWLTLEEKKPIPTASTKTIN